MLFSFSYQTLSDGHIVFTVLWLLVHFRREKMQFKKMITRFEVAILSEYNPIANYMFFRNKNKNKFLHDGN